MGNKISLSFHLRRLIFIVIIVLGVISNGFGERIIVPVGGIFNDENSIITNIFRHKLNDLNNLYQTEYYITNQTHEVVYDDSFRAGKMACNMTDLGVAAIFGPQSYECGSIVESICHNLKIPHIQIHSELTPPNPDYSKLGIKMYPSTSVLSQAYADILNTLEWKSFTVIYENDDAFIRLQDILRLPRGFEDLVTIRQMEGDDFRPMLKEIQKSGERRIILDCSTDMIMKVLLQATEVHLADEYIEYFIINLDTRTVSFEPIKHNLNNITTVSMINPFDADLHAAIYRLQSDIPGFRYTEENFDTQLALIYDAVSVFYEGLIGANLDKELTVERVDCKAADDTWTDGERFHDALKKVEIDGLTGPIKFDENGHRTHFTLQTLYLYQEGFKRLSTWDPENKIVNIRSQAETEAQYSAALRNKTLRVASRIGPPYLMIKNQSLEGNSKFEGYSLDIIDELSKLTGFKYEFYTVEKYGSYDKATKKWDGLIKELLDRNADLAICDLTITFDRRSAVDFTMPFMTLGISILGRKPSAPPSDIFKFMKPLSTDVWIMMSIAFLGVAAMSYIISRMCPKDWENPTPQNPDPEELENIWSIQNCIWLAFGAVMCMGCDLLPKGSSSRMAIGFWWFFALIVIQSYIANLTAFLTSGLMGDTIGNVEELVKQTTVKYGVVKGGSTGNFFKNSNFSIYQKMWSTMEAQRPSVFTSGNPEGVDRVRNGDGKYMFLMESTSLEYETQRNCELMQVGGKLDSKGYGIAMPRNSPYRTEISAAVLRLQEAGTLARLKTKWWEEMHGGGGCPTEEVIDANEMGIDNVGGIFVVLAAGCVVSFTVVCLEFLWNVKNVALEKKISLTSAFRSEFIFAFHLLNKEKPAPVPESEPSSKASGSQKSLDRRSQRSLTANILQSTTSILRLNKLLDKNN